MCATIVAPPRLGPIDRPNAQVFPSPGRALVPFELGLYGRAHPCLKRQRKPNCSRRRLICLRGCATLASSFHLIKSAHYWKHCPPYRSRNSNSTAFAGSDAPCPSAGTMILTVVGSSKLAHCPISCF